MFEKVRVSPSILSSDFMNLQSEVESIEAGGADWVHVDVMDGHFVPNLTIGVPVVSQLSRISKLPLDVHLMISNPLVQLPWFLESKPELVCIHWEALDASRPNDEARAAVELIHGAGSKAAIALKPDTDISVLSETIALWDMVLVMSVFPGFSGQSFIPETPDRIRQLVELAKSADAHPLIQVDGGVNPTTAALVAAAGADVLVAGNGVFKAPDRALAISEIRTSATNAR